MKIPNFIFNQENKLYISSSFSNFNYKDGSENYLIEIFKKENTISSYPVSLYKYIRDWPSRYHLTYERVYILDAIKDLIPKQSKVLELGAGLGGLTIYLADNFMEVDAIEGDLIRAKAIRIRGKERKNLNVYVGDITKIDYPPRMYDLIVLIGVLEYIPYYLENEAEIAIIDFLKKISLSIKDSGLLILGIENKLGAKYFTGCTEDHNGKLFSGLIDYPEKSPLTFSRNEIEEFLKLVGFNNIQFYHLFPDYKIPKLFIREDNKFYDLKPTGLLRGNFEDYSGKRVYLFPDLLFLESLIKAKVLFHFSNSFLIIGSKDKKTNLKTKWIVRKYWNEAKINSQLHHTIDVFLNGDDNFRVERRPLESTTNIVDLKTISCNFHSMNWVKGDSLLIKAYKSLIKDDNFQSFDNLLKDLLENLLIKFYINKNDEEGYPLVSGEAFDYTFWNLKIDKSLKWVFIDPKWSCKNYLPGDYILFRNLLALYNDFKPYIKEKNEKIFILERIRKIFSKFNYERLKDCYLIEYKIKKEINGFTDISINNETIVYVSTLEEEINQLINSYEKLGKSEINSQNDNKLMPASSRKRKDPKKIRLIAFYLPQFHPIPENDQWWGKGFTEWTNVTKASPLFNGHYQPHLPADLGFYDLRLPEVRKMQADLAREYGIYGFCYYHYWFKGRRLLERPFDEVLRSREPDFPFCLCWANENWTKRWDGHENEILQKQEYSEKDDLEHIRWLIGVFKDNRYIRVNGRPLILIYRAHHHPNPVQLAQLWRDEAKRFGIGEIYLCKVESFPEDYGDPKTIGFDASIEFQPAWKYLGPPSFIHPHGNHYVYRYDEVIDRMLRRDKVSYKRYPCVFPCWDNSPRRKSEAIIINGSTPDLYGKWLEECLKNFEPFSEEENFVFINAWNEWGECNHLEPDQKFGRGYLEATRRAIWLSGCTTDFLNTEDIHNACLNLVQEERYQEAIRGYEYLLKRNSNNPIYYNDLGVLSYKLGDKNSAIQCISKAIELEPENKEFLINLADIYIELNEFKKAYEIYGKIIKKNQKESNIIAKAGYCLFQMGNLKDASCLFKKVLEIEPENELAKEYLDKIKNNNDINEISNLKSDKELAEHTSPMVSIVIPVWNNLELTHNCLKSILLNTSGCDYEIIFVDNGSTDITRDYLENLNYKNIKKIFLDQNIGFVGACNSGAKLASGKYLLFLNNDTEVQKDWLKALVDFAESMPDCGAVGSKLIYPDGRLQEAGGIIFSDGNGWNYGRGMDSEDPKFNYVREVDYCSGAALMVRKDLWVKIGGFDERYAPAYYEDTDLCFEIRKHGFRVYYQPKSIVIHHEGKTAGTDLNSGYKKYQTINREKFIAKWSYELKEQLPNDPKNIFKAANRGIRRNILVIDAFLPFFDRASGSLRLFNILKILKEMKFHITFIARNGYMEKYYRPILENMGIEVYAWDPLAMKAAGYIIDSKKNIPYESLLKERKYEYALIEFWHIAEYYLPIIRKYSLETKIIIDTVDIHFVREIREAELKKDGVLKNRAQLNKKREIAIYRNADRLWVVTENDKKAIKDYVGKIPIDIIANIHSSNGEEKKYEDTSDLLFVGNFNHPPNYDAIQYFCQGIYPLIQKKLPEVKLYIVGNNPPPDVLSLSSDKIIVTGYVKDLSPYLKRARVSVNPLRYGAGMKGKIGEALSWGLPVVTTSIGAEGMGLSEGVDALIADSAEEFAKKVILLYGDKELWEKLSINGKKKVEIEWSPSSIKKRIERIFFADKELKDEKLVSIIILAHNQLSYTVLCLESILRYTNLPYELIIIDNGSKDNTPEFLEKLSKGEEVIADWRIWTDSEGRIIDRKRVKIHTKKKNKGVNKIFSERFKFIRCDRNLGFAAGNNLGISEAKGDYILLMNNDIVVTPHWLARLLRVAEMKPEIGIVGPVSNYVSGPQQVKEITYDVNSLKNLNQFAKSWARKNEHHAKPFWRVVGFCMLIKREVISRIGGLDERFGLGNFEDDDFCLRAKLAGFESWIAEDCFIHHFGSKTFQEVGLDYNQSLKVNWEVFKKKWGIPEEVQYGENHNLGYILKNGFNPVKHYYPISKDRLSISQAEELFNLGDLEGAKILFQKILSFDPKNIEALNDLGVICFHQGEVDLAISYFKGVLELNEDHLETIENLSQCLIAKGQFQEAIPWLKKALSIKPRDEKLLNLLANYFIQVEDLFNAEETYRKSYQINNEQPQVEEILRQIEKIKKIENQRGMEM